MKTLAEIITDCKDGKTPEYDELRYAVVALDILLAQTKKDLGQATSVKSEFLRRIVLQRSDEGKHIAYNKPPKERKKFLPIIEESIEYAKQIDNKFALSTAYHWKGMLISDENNAEETLCGAF